MRFPNRIPLFALVFLLLAVSPAAASENKNSLEKTWAFEGLMTDACQCHVFCPCEFAQKPTYGHCDDTAILHVKKVIMGPWDQVPRATP